MNTYTVYFTEEGKRQYKRAINRIEGYSEEDALLRAGYNIKLVETIQEVLSVQLQNHTDILEKIEQMREWILKKIRYAETQGHDTTALISRWHKLQELFPQPVSIDHIEIPEPSNYTTKPEKPQQ